MGSREADGRERYSAPTGESIMGIFSWLSRWREDTSEQHSLVRRDPGDDPELEEIRRDAAADVAELEQDDKFFGAVPPADQDDGL
jgi:hypothetical protein